MVWDLEWKFLYELKGLGTLLSNVIWEERIEFESSLHTPLFKFVEDITELVLCDFLNFLKRTLKHRCDISKTTPDLLEDAIVLLSILYHFETTIYPFIKELSIDF